MNRANKIKLGAFILISIILLIGGFLATGITQIFAPKVSSMTVLDTSVEGLSIGSPVKYLGLQVGKITRIAMRRSDNYIAVYFDLSSSAMDQIEVSKTGFSSSSDLAEMLKSANPSCFINASGIMGGTFLELTLGESTPHELPNLGQIPEDVLFIRSKPSHIGSAIQNISQVLEELNKVNFVLMAEKMDQALDSMNNIFSRSDISSVIQHLNSTSRDLETTAKNLKTLLSKENIHKLSSTLDNVERTTNELNEVITPKAIQEILENFNLFMADSRQFLKKTENAGSELSGELVTMRRRLEESLTRLDNSTRQLNRFINNVEDDPNQFVRGRQSNTEPFNNN